MHLNGAGTTNPSKYLWKIMDLFDERTRVDTKLSYRAVGSSTGYKEMTGQTPDYQAYNDFGAGDIPIPQSYYDDIASVGRGIVHVPFVMGAIGIFHSVPESDFGSSGEVDLSACLLAKIFSRTVTTWDHADILAENPGFSPPAGQNINVVHRTLGSSSTAGTTEYLATACPAEWSADNTGSTVTWAEDTVAAQGSGGVSASISENAYSIGYLDSGHGHDDNLSEVALQNADGIYLKTTDADIGAAGAIKAAEGTFPAGSDSWADVNLYNLPGADTWPITQIGRAHV